MAVFDLLSHAEAPTSLQASVCVIGAGMAGLTAARRLARSGQRVIVLESGGRAFDQLVHELNRLEDVSGRYTRAMTGHYRGLGGSSTRWGGRMLPISIGETRNRVPELPEWPFAIEDLQRYHGEIENMFGIDGGSYDEAALADLDKDAIVPRNDPDFTARMAKWPKLRNCNLAHVLGAELRAASNVEIWLHATVCDFEPDSESGRLSSVIARNSVGRELTVRADRFVLAAGTIEATRLLLWIKAKTGDNAFARAPALGRYLQDHINVRVARVSRRDTVFSNRFCAYRFHKGTRRSLHLELTPAVQGRERVAGAFAYFTMDFADTALDSIKTAARSLQTGDFGIGHASGIARQLPSMARLAWWHYARHQLFLSPEVPIHLEICAEQVPDERNMITLSAQRDALGLPRARVAWRPMKADERTLRAAARRLAGYWSRHELDRRMPLDWIAPCRDPDGSIAEVAVDYAHPSGTARMGTDATSSIVDPDLVCHDIPNLSVMSAAVFPSAGSANPTFTLLALALRHADYLSRAEARRPATSVRPARTSLPDTQLAGVTH
ncbi:hypothetical protein VE25_11380 [Devosia geojensis]|uniref:Uncharacterized protein n=1 Tax=Devosia geojensis TaxID=443610 RepID=A0A0F5FT57_9HYPH|nr:GMC family oxidoreductase [Devosia geojensis]KKB11765.1 hypothetical protein VE25_11380 [Devosia geojensis]